MHVSISGQNITVGNALQDYVKDRICMVVQKYFEHATSATVHFAKHGYQFTCDIIVNDGTGRHLIIKSNAISDEVYAAFDSALVKAEKQLRKYKTKLKSHHDRIKISKVVAEATEYVISPHREEEAADSDNDDNPVIIADKPVEITPLSVGDAVMKMDLENLPALMFQNVKTGRINIVYYRRDGNISWVDSK